MATGYAYPAQKYDPYKKTSSSSTSTVAMPEVVPYVPPAWDTGRIESLTQELGAAGIGKLRRGLESGIASLQYTDNPWARKEQTRNLLAGYGEGIGGITTGARQGALNVYGAEYGAQAEAGKASWLEKMLRERQKYQTESTAQTETTSGGGGGGSMSSGSSKKGTTFLNIPTPLAGMSIGTSGGGKVGGSGWSENPWASTPGANTAASSPEAGWW